MEKEIKPGTKYDPMNAPTEKHGGNDAIHDGIETDEGYGPPKMQTTKK